MPKDDIEYDLPPETSQPITIPEIDIETFKMMIDIRCRALDLAIKMPNSRLPSTIFEKAERIEKWLTRK